MLSVIVVLIDAGSCPRGSNLDNRGVTLGPIFSTGSRLCTASLRSSLWNLANLASVSASVLESVSTSGWSKGRDSGVGGEG